MDTWTYLYSAIAALVVCLLGLYFLCALRAEAWREVRGWGRRMLAYLEVWALYRELRKGRIE
jgi:hypothetical protein